MAAAAAAVAVLAVLGAPAPAGAQVPLDASTVAARKHFFGSTNVNAAGRVRSDRVILSWFSVGSLAAAFRGRVVLLDTYVHKGEERPGYVPTTTAELRALRPEAIFVGHGHFDHAKSAGEIAAHAGALLVGTAEHCAQARREAAGHGHPAARVRCLQVEPAGSPPGGGIRSIRPLGDTVEVDVLKHVHSAAEPPDGEGHETSLMSPVPPDGSSILLHPPGPSLVGGLSPEGDEGGTLLYQFRIGAFALTWHDSAGPLRERGPKLFGLLRALPRTDVQVGAALGFNDPTNGMRDIVDYVVTLRPKVFQPVHHDFVAEYGASKGLEGVFRRELAKRADRPAVDVRWTYDPHDYLRPDVFTFDPADPAWADAVAPAPPSPAARARCLPAGTAVTRRGIGRVGLGLTRLGLARATRLRPAAARRFARAFCVAGGGRVTAVFDGTRTASRARLLVTTAPRQRARAVGPGSAVAALRRRFPLARRAAPGLYRAFPRSVHFFGVRGGRVRFVAVTDRGLAAFPVALRRYLARAGV